MRNASTGDRHRLVSAGNLCRAASKQCHLLDRSALSSPFTGVYRIDPDRSERGEQRANLASREQASRILVGKRLEEH